MNATKFNLLQFSILLLIFLISYSNLSHAQETSEVILQQDRITRDQQNQLEEDKRIKEQETIKKERLRKKKEEEKLKQEPIPNESSQCFVIKEIKLINADSNSTPGRNSLLISKSQQQKLTLPFLNKCFDGKTVSELTAAIESFYRNKGYAAAKAASPRQNVQSGILEIKIMEGKIGKIILGDNKFTDKMQELTAFGFLEGNILNINDINQGIYQINRLPSNNAVMKIKSGTTDGEAEVLIDNQQKFPARASIGYDNLGNDFTGVKRTAFSGGLDNLLFLNDNINLTYITNLNDDNQTKDIKSFTGGISVPFLYNTFSYDYSRSDYKGTTARTSSIIKLSGFSQANSFTIDRVLLSKTDLRISANANLAAKSSASYLNDAKIATSERKLSIGNLGLTVSSYFKNGANLYLKPSFSKGLKILNAKQDGANSTDSTPKAQFEVFKLYASLSKRFNTQIPFSLSTEMDSQISKDTLFGSEQFAVGGYYSVRGFLEDYITGDSGYYFRNKAGFNVGSLISPIFNSENNNSSNLSNYLSQLNKFQIEPFYDYGYVKSKYNDNSGRLSGAGIKTIFDSKYFAASLTYSWAINKSALISSAEKENKMVYFELRGKCC